MYLRFVRLQVRAGQEAAFTRFYQERVIPALAATEGCLYAGLLAPWRGDAHQSLTIWASAEHAGAYEASGLYHGLLGQAGAMLADRAEWRVRLARDPLETADPSRRAPPSKGYVVEADEGSAALEGDDRAPFVRIVSLRVAPGRLEEFVAIYHQQVIPALKQVPGCLGVFLAEGADDARGVTSITLWSREEHAVRYEMSGEFERLTARLRDTFATIFGWGAALPAASGRAGVDVSTYQVVRGRRLSDIV
jgi:heme-degrading monooxygenase HmoA